MSLNFGQIILLFSIKKKTYTKFCRALKHSWDYISGTSFYNWKWLESYSGSFVFNKRRIYSIFRSKKFHYNFATFFEMLKRTNFCSQNPQNHLPASPASGSVRSQRPCAWIIAATESIGFSFFSIALGSEKLPGVALAGFFCTNHCTFLEFHCDDSATGWAQWSSQEFERFGVLRSSLSLYTAVTLA